MSNAFDNLQRDVGFDIAITLCLHHGGSCMSIPKKAENSYLFHEYGADAEIIVAAFGGEQIYIPVAGQEVALWMRDEGMEISAIANRLNCAVRTVQRWIYEPRKQKASSQVLPLEEFINKSV